LSEHRSGLEFSWAAKPEPETDTFGHEARTCSPAQLLGFLKFVGTSRCNDARRHHPCAWHSQGALAAMAWRRTSEQPRRVAICTDRRSAISGQVKYGIIALVMRGRNRAIARAFVRGLTGGSSKRAIRPLLRRRTKAPNVPGLDDNLRRMSRACTHKSTTVRQSLIDVRLVPTSGAKADIS
jgi:hypothetical protein